MEEKIKDIISVFLKVPPSEIGSNTLINRQAVSSSIILHRMYGALANQGFVIDNYTGINTYSELLLLLSKNEMGSASTIESSDASAPILPAGDFPADVGIDLEFTDNFPLCDDYRENEFYKNNFTNEEISYCLLKKNPIESFAGLFSIKESIVKADNSYRGRPFNTIAISHDDSGKPIHPEFLISVSHQNNQVISIAISKKNPIIANVPFSRTGNSDLNKFSNQSGFYISILALIISVISLIIVFLL